MGLTQVNSEGIKDGEIKDADVNASAAIAKSKLASLDIVNADVNASAAIAGSKLAAATTSAAGSMSAADKTKLDGVATSATANPSAPALTGSTNNTITTVTGANAIQGEANLTYDGTHLTVGTSTSNASDALTVYDPGNAFMSIRSDAAADNQNQVFDFGVGTGDRGSSNLTGTVQAVIHSQSGGTLKSDLYFSTNGGNSISERFRIKDTGNVEIKDGDLVIKTAGHGIDFSINSHASGMTSELLHGYEEGTWTPDFFYHSSVTGVEGHYTKIGRMVYAYFCGTFYSNSGSQQYISNLPFTVANISGSAGGVARGYQNYDIQNGPIYWMEQNTTKMYFYKDNGVSFTGADGNGNNFRGMVVYTATS